MKRTNGAFILSASDLVSYLNCRHLADLEQAVAEGTLARPQFWDPMLAVLQERGELHEQSYVDALGAHGLNIVRIDGVDITGEAVAQTLAAMHAGTDVIVQGALRASGWSGRPDILRRVDVPSALGTWSYEVTDTKLARETKAGTMLQLCVYSELLAAAQGIAPEHMHVVAPWSDFQPQTYRFADFAAYYRRAKRAFELSLQSDSADRNYPEPTDHCDICRWRDSCAQRRRDDDHLCLVAGISKLQINELRRNNVPTMHALATQPVPLRWKPDRGSVHTYERAREQARVQVEARESGHRKFELLPIEPGLGLARLPEPSDGDIFLDFEGDPFVGQHGIEYLVGYAVRKGGERVYHGDWAFSRVQEKQVFETFVDFAILRWQAFPDLHIYHYAAYEPAALKRLMGRYGTREEEVDRMLRAKLFVDLYDVVRHSVRASVESYSIKKLEPFYEFERQVPLPDVNSALARLERHLELNEFSSITDKLRTAVENYNRDDCLSASSLRDWLESLRLEEIAKGADIQRPESEDGAATENVTAWIAKIQALAARLTAGVSDEPKERTAEQNARWILAHILDWHRREDKATWWDYFRLCELPADDLLDERAGISGLVFERAVASTGRTPVHRYRFDQQDTEIREDDDLKLAGGDSFGKVQSISLDNWTIDIKKRQDTAAIHPTAVFAHSIVRTKVLAEALVRLGEYVAEHGITGEGPFQAARDLLLREAPRVGDQLLRNPGETALDAAIRLARTIDRGVLPIQGPPGSGKTFTGARMICEFVRQGKKVGIVANSHKVIRNMLDTVVREADKLGIDLNCCEKVGNPEQPVHRLSFATENDEMVRALASSNVGGATAWFWARPEVRDRVDVLVVDEAAQMSLANVLAISQAARALILIGDPQQLDQPTQGTHPDGCKVSALDHVLGDKATIPADRGLFLEDTWRLHPGICAFTSELFYEDKLHSRPELARQVIKSTGPIQGSGLRYLAVPHDGNQSWSAEEAKAVQTLVSSILDSGSTWIDSKGVEHPVTLNDILIIAPYNAQVFEVQRRLPGARVGTVDKFQGQEAPIAIYSTATSSYADAPRGMEFLYSLNRLNVATSRAKCVSIVVSSPRILEAECRTPGQMKLANAFCRYQELADSISLRSPVTAEK